MKFEVQPSNVAVNKTMSPAVIFDLENPDGADEVRLSIVHDDPAPGLGHSVSLCGTTKGFAKAGKVTFDNLCVGAKVTGAKLVACVTGQADVTSASFDVT